MGINAINKILFFFYKVKERFVFFNFIKKIFIKIINHMESKKKILKISQN